MDPFQGVNLAPSLNTFKTKTNNSMLRVKQDNLDPMNVTSDRMKNGIATKTSRDTGVQGTITEYRDDVVSVLDGVIGAISHGLLNTKDITKSIKVGRDGVTFDTDGILAAASRQLGFPVSSESNAMRKVANEINSEFTRITGVNLGGLVTTDGKKFAANKNWRSIIGGNTLKMLTKLTGVDQFVDRSVTSALYNTLFNNAAQYGMRNGYRGIWNSYPAGFGDVRRDAALEALKYMITNGDIKSIKEVLAILDEDDLGIEKNHKMIRSKYPNFIEILFSNFRFNDDVFPEDYPALLADMLEVFERIIGPNWWMKYTEFGEAANLAIMTRVSKDMIKLLSGYEPIIPLLCTAGRFTESSALIELRSQFKSAPKFPR